MSQPDALEVSLRNLDESLRRLEERLFSIERNTAYASYLLELQRVRMVLDTNPAECNEKTNGKVRPIGWWESLRKFWKQQNEDDRGLGDEEGKSDLLPKSDVVQGG